MTETTPRPDTPDELMLRMADALNGERWGSMHAQIGEHRNHGFYAPCGICQGSVPAILALLTPVLKEREAEIERRVREQVAAEIEANPMNECSGAVMECARIARGGNR